MGLEQPFIVQFWIFLKQLLHGNMGVSARTGNSVLSETGQRLPYTVELAVLETLFGVVVGIFLGVLAARHKGKIMDTISSMSGVMGISMPVYWLGSLLILPTSASSAVRRSPQSVGRASTSISPTWLSFSRPSCVPSWAI